jgi:hypothetical protein
MNLVVVVDVFCCCVLLLFLQENSKNEKGWYNQERNTKSCPKGAVVRTVY